ncbi:SDR family NAD(P)-dependent oxidoreductase [Aeromicrobium sp. CF3.5]|uniref:SDR family NAD(P)-dependent oxidoreductase n=1 Tax=Aeromicrobium sp. CF3.5 TaxID=3373078 RepID=UPI003EE779C3
MTLAGRTVVITGASSGIGAQAARQLADRGATVCLVARRAAELELVGGDIRAAGGVAHLYPTDLTDSDSCDALSRQLLADHPVIDVLVNNAARSIRRPINESTDRAHDHERTMAINYLAAVRLTLALVPRFVEQGHGHVVVSSTLSTQIPIPLFSAYLASKSALESFARSLAAELGGSSGSGGGVTSTIVYFPMVRTEMSGATSIYSAMPMMSPADAAGWLVRAVEKRPARISRRSGVLGEIAMATVPGLTVGLTRPLFRRMDASLKRASSRH